MINFFSTVFFFNSYVVSSLSFFFFRYFYLFPFLWLLQISYSPFQYNSFYIFLSIPSFKSINLSIVCRISFFQNFFVLHPSYLTLSSCSFPHFYHFSPSVFGNTSSMARFLFYLIYLFQIRIYFRFYSLN